MVGHEHPALLRVGALFVYVPLLIVGYAFVLASAAWTLALGLGWSLSLLLLGLAHLAGGGLGLLRSRIGTAASSYDVLEPECAQDRSQARSQARPAEPSAADLSLTPEELGLAPARQAGQAHHVSEASWPSTSSSGLPRPYTGRLFAAPAGDAASSDDVVAGRR